MWFRSIAISYTSTVNNNNNNNNNNEIPAKIVGRDVERAVARALVVRRSAPQHCRIVGRLPKFITTIERLTSDKEYYSQACEQSLLEAVAWRWPMPAVPDVWCGVWRETGPTTAKSIDISTKQTNKQQQQQ
jgi:hypothetical protein